MSGSALYECVAAIFVAQAYGIELSTRDPIPRRPHVAHHLHWRRRHPFSQPCCDHHHSPRRRPSCRRDRPFCRRRPPPRHVPHHRERL